VTFGRVSLTMFPLPDGNAYGNCSQWESGFAVELCLTPRQIGYSEGNHRVRDTRIMAVPKPNIGLAMLRTTPTLHVRFAAKDRRS